MTTAYDELIADSQQFYIPWSNDTVRHTALIVGAEIQSITPLK